MEESPLAVIYLAVIIFGAMIVTSIIIEIGGARSRRLAKKEIELVNRENELAQKMKEVDEVAEYYKRKKVRKSKVSANKQRKLLTFFEAGDLNAYGRR